MTVLHLVSNPWWTGAGTAAAELCCALARLGHRVLFACAEGHRLAEMADRMGLERPGGLDLRRTLNPRRLLQQARSLRRLVRREGVEVLHCHLSHDHWLAALSGFPHGRGRSADRTVADRTVADRTVLVRTFHKARAIRGDPLSRWLFGRADAAIAPNSHIARLLRERGALPPERIREVRGGVDVSAFCPLSAEERRRARAGLGAEPDELLVGILARLQPRRRHADLLEAFVAVRREIPRARLLIAGKGEGRGGLEARTARLRLKDAVTFTGYWEGDLREVLGALDLFVLLAPGSDGSGRALLEAQAVGLASLAVDREGLADAVEKGVTAHVVPAGGPRPLAEALTALLRDPGRRESLGRAARRRALEELDWAHVAGHVEAIYGECLERLRSRCGGGGGRSGRAAPSSASRHLEREVAGR